MLSSPDDLLGVGFVWSQASVTSQTIYQENEYALDTFYTLQLTPPVKLQSDLQTVWNPAFNPNAGLAAVFQLPIVLSW